MTTELHWLIAITALTAIFWIPYILDRVAVRGVMGAFANPSPDLKPQSAWAQRMQDAHYNAVENLAVFAPLVLIAHVVGVSTTATVLAVQLYFWGRLIHFIVYSAGWIVIRTLAFLLGFIAQAIFIWELLFIEPV